MEVLLNLRIPKNSLLVAYIEALESEDLDDVWRCDFVYCGAILIDRGATMPGHDFRVWRDRFLRVPVEMQPPYYEEACLLMNRLNL
jgi:hypothetical protein